MSHTNRPSLTGERFRSRRSVVMTHRGVVATSQPLAAQAGLRMLLAGGSAADAVVAAAAALNVVEPMSTGIGGDAFALIYDAQSRTVHALNGSGRAPAALSRETFTARGLTGIPLTGMLPVTVPGAVDAWVELLAAYGRLPLSQVLAPAIDYAENGFPVSEIIARGWKLAEPKLAAHPDTARTYLPQGRAPRAGELFRQPGLARSLRLIAEGGRDAFYRGAIAAAIAATSARDGGALTLEDLAAHRSTWETPISVTYRGYTVYECPPNGQGITALIALNILEGFDMAALPPASPEALHLQIEALRLAFADAAAYVADPAHVHVPTDRLLSAAHASARRAQIDPQRAMPSVHVGALPGGHDTVYVTAVDADGNAVSFINSLYMGFGSGVVAGDTGICLQNRGAGFVLDPNHPNCVAPGKRPYHTIIPCMVTRGDRLWASFGVMGGFMQPQGHVQMLVNMIDFGMNPQEALDAPRFELIDPYLSQDAVALEHDPAIAAALTARGHHVVDRQGMFGFGGGQIIVVDDAGVRHAGSDPRKDGCAVAY
ncbi:gamma-glutamyltransferase [Roseiflexus sp.]|uniref:gamma-glutamyltransferase n=1 Tax=Roseiflexus sp. TaxID=2562120 RepID=UPI0021DE5A79|nr:gamma-glutamyltransferase [Roseiflexus sp.]GIW00480.1 MAG: gamma-glutamyltransferase [Roseiflexus sp.]